MKLYLVRHGIAVDIIGGTVNSDFDRYLTDEGQRESEIVAGALKKIGVKPDLLVSSPLVRAVQTAEVFGKVLGCREPVKICEALQPGGRFIDVAAALSKSRANEIMFFGHEPDMGNHARVLLGGGSDFHIPFKKAGVCRIDVFHLPPAATGVLKWLITPKIARAMLR